MTYKISELLAPSFYAVHRAIKHGQVTELLAKGGRGSTKSSAISVEVVLTLLRNPNCHAVALRRYGNTLRTSVYAQICWAINALGLSEQFRCTVSPMECIYRKTGQKILFFGLDDPQKIKSIKTTFGYIGVLWFEELDQYDSDAEVRNVEQSCLRGGAMMITFKSFNPPAMARSWVNRYALEERTGKLVHHSTYLQVPADWLGPRFIADAEWMRDHNQTVYRHEYLGEVVGSGTAVFENIRPESIAQAQIDGFDRVYRGVDWGYYPDPFAYNEVHYDAARHILYIFGEITARRLGNIQTAELIRARGRSELICADSAEPKSISDFKAEGLPCVGAKKGAGSVEHGMKWLQSLDAIVIDPVRCPDTFREFSEYEYERDRAGNVIDGYPDVDNHHIDAIRYAMETVSTRRVAKVIKR